MKNKILLNDIKFMTDEAGNEHIRCAAIFYLLVLISAFTLKYMLMGKFSEVLSEKAATGKDDLLMSYVKGVLEYVH